MTATGRRWYVVDGDDELLSVDEWDAPDLPYAIWTEFDGPDGKYYVSDHEDYTLTAEEFGPIPGDR